MCGTASLSPGHLSLQPTFSDPDPVLPQWGGLVVQLKVQIRPPGGGVQETRGPSGQKDEVPLPCSRLISSSGSGEGKAEFKSELCDFGPVTAPL